VPDLDPRTTALLVMDYQPGVLELLGDAAEHLLDRAAEAIATMRRAGGTVGYVRVAFTPEDIAAMPPTSGMAARVGAAPERFEADAPITRVHERVAPQAGDVEVRKTRVGAFSTTDLDAQLRERGIDTLLLAGVSTSGVVLSTVRDASDRDYRLFVVADATADPDPEVHGCLMDRVFPRQATIVITGELDGLL
jgi:nicotinamidase-related amidase